MDRASELDPPTKDVVALLGALPANEISDSMPSPGQLHTKIFGCRHRWIRTAFQGVASQGDLVRVIRLLGRSCSRGSGQNWAALANFTQKSSDADSVRMLNVAPESAGESWSALASVGQRWPTSQKNLRMPTALDLESLPGCSTAGGGLSPWAHPGPVVASADCVRNYRWMRLHLG